MKADATVIFLLLSFALGFAFAGEEGVAEIRRAIDAYIDSRWEAKTGDTEALVKRIRAAGLDFRAVERILREGRAECPDPPRPPGQLGIIGLDCEHVDCSTISFLYVPKGYSKEKSWPLILVGHGGSGARDQAFGMMAAQSGLVPYREGNQTKFRWVDLAEQRGFLLAAPITERGWGNIGNSILLSLVSKLAREYRIDPDRIYITGHSMGGHLSWRSGIYLGDRWGAVSPMSGGYDYVKTREVYNLFNVPGYATCGKKEPYGIHEVNGILREWMTAHGYPWVFAEKEGGHEIFPDELPKVIGFFEDHPRNPYPAKVCACGGGSLANAQADKNDQWHRQHNWRPGRPIPVSTFHWIRFLEPAPKAADGSAVQRVWAVNDGRNVLSITAENCRRLRVYLHERMVDFAKPVKIAVNGETLFEKQVEPDLATMLELVREFDDRGRIYHAAVDLAIKTDKPVPEPANK